jgi:hypothetical protein
MTILTKLFASLALVFGLVSIANAASISLADDSFAVYQSDTEDTGEEKKKEGDEEEEPDC